MIRKEKEYRNNKELLSDLEAELQGLSVRSSAERNEVVSAVMDALRFQIEGLEHEVSEYEDFSWMLGLREGPRTCPLHPTTGSANPGAHGAMLGPHAVG